MRVFASSNQLYCLAIHHDRKESITVGSLGKIQWDHGWTYYVGRSSYGWASRLRRFTDSGQKLHWHVDYLLDQSTARLKTVFPFDEAGERECDLAGWFRDRSGFEPLAEGLGASDCGDGCPAHAFQTTHSSDHTRVLLEESRFELSGTVEFKDNSCDWNRS
jgi:Uri superfamily endonuclease